MRKGLVHACVGVSDVERATAFYRDKLGFEEAYDFVSPKGDKYGQCMRLGGGTFLELFRSDFRMPGPTHWHFCVLVDDLNAEVAALRGRGVEVTEPKRGTDRSWAAWVTDPDGNRIEFQQYTDESKQLRSQRQG